jgi:hypothetical protein
MAESPIYINGQAYSFTDMVVNINGVPLQGVTSIDYSDEQEMEEYFSNGKFPSTFGSAKYTATGKISVDRADYNAIVNASPNKRIQENLPIDIPVSYVPASNIPTTDILRGVRFKGASLSMSEGDGRQVVELELKIGRIDWNNL